MAGTMEKGNVTLSHGIAPEVPEKQNHGKRLCSDFPWHCFGGAGGSEPWKKVTQRYPMAPSRRKRRTVTMEKVNVAIFHGTKPEKPENRNHGKR